MDFRPSCFTLFSVWVVDVDLFRKLLTGRFSRAESPVSLFNVLSLKLIEHPKIHFPKSERVNYDENRSNFPQ